MRPRELVVAWVEAFNCGNPDEMATFYAERAVNHQVVREPVEGRAAIREMFAKDVASAKMVCIADHISASSTIFSRMVRGPFSSGEIRSGCADAVSSASRTIKSSLSAAIGTGSRL